MEALLVRCAVLAAAVASLGASYRTPNFVVEAPTPQMAEQIGQRPKNIAASWPSNGSASEMPNWSQPCPITAQVADHLGAGGATSFVFEHGEVFGWRMTIQGSLVRILDSVLPHEVTHTIFATHFRQPLPRWADEGACTTVEHASERAKQQTMLIEFPAAPAAASPSTSMFAMKEYPHDVMPLYSQGYSLARYLIAQGGKRKFLEFLADGMRDENWTRATQEALRHRQPGARCKTTGSTGSRKGSPPLDATPKMHAAGGRQDARTIAGAGRGRTPSRRDARPTRQLAAPSVGEPARRGRRHRRPQRLRRWRRPSPARCNDAGRASAADDSAPTAPAPTVDAAAGRATTAARSMDAAGERRDRRPQPRASGDAAAGSRSVPRQVILEWSRPPGSDRASPCGIARRPASAAAPIRACARLYTPRHEEEPRQVVEDRRGEADRVDAVQHAAVAFDQRAVVLHAAVALDGRHGHAAGKAHHGDHRRHGGGLPGLEGRGPPQRRADQASRWPCRRGGLPRCGWG